MSTPPRAQLDALLQAAVAEGDAVAARRIADQLVHRRGVGALEALMEGPLAALQGPEAVAWLRGLVYGSAASSTEAIAAAPALPVAPSVEPTRAEPTAAASAPGAFATAELASPELETAEFATAGLDAAEAALAELAMAQASSPEPVALEPEGALPLPSAPPSLPRRVVPFLFGRRPASPAPVPAALAALRCWLPEDGGLPKAS